MEIRLSIWMAFLVVAAVSQHSEARHSRERREADGEPYDVQSDYASDTDQNSNSSTVNETTPDVNILTAKTTYDITIGQSVRLECRTDSAAVVEWIFITQGGNEYLVVANQVVSNKTENNTTATSPKFIFDTEATTNLDLIVKSAEPKDSGVYRCKVMQEKVTYVDHKLMVSEKPKITSISASRDPETGLLYEGTDLVLTCEATGFPKPEIIWSVQENINDSATPSVSNRKLTEKDGVFDNNTVTIRNVKKEQSGWYFCYVVSPAGSDTKALLVSVLGKPRVHLPKTAVNSAINVEAFLQCTVHEEIPSRIDWLLNDHLLISNTNVTNSTMGSQFNLTVVPTSDADFGLYTCRATNPSGYHSLSVKVVETPVIESFLSDGPKVTFRVQSHQALEEISLQLREITSGNFTSKEISLPGERHHEYEITYVIENLQPNKYEAIVKVKNTKGWSDEAYTIVEIAGQQQLIQSAGVVYGGNAAINRPATVLLPTVLMYLLVRML